MKKIVLFILFIPCFLFISCKKESPDIIQVDRTLIVYMAADNDLSYDAVKNLQQIKNGYRNTGANLLVFMDTADKTPKLLRITKEEREPIKTYFELNSVSAENINEVLQEIITLYPSESYGLVLWSHGTSWLPAGSRLRSFGDDNGRQLNIPELAEALPVCFDFILFDACLMGAVEVAYELRSKADYILAPSTETIADGFPYDLIIPELLKEKPDLKWVAQSYFNHYDMQKGAYRSATISLIDTKELDMLAVEMKKLWNENDTGFGLFDRNSVQRLDAFDKQYHFDLLDFVEKKFPETDKTDFISQLNKAVLYKANTPRFIEMYDINTYCGLSCYIPHPNRSNLNTYYKTLNWSIDSGVVDYIALK